MGHCDNRVTVTRLSSYDFGPSVSRLPPGIGNCPHFPEVHGERG